ncbi:MAG: DNA helicase PcrA [Eubacteriales bacterium]|nr:DNA helicase PcrA [Eubacteriales bacterium]
MNYLDKLNPEQRAAVEQTQGPLLVLAGAGSGKTRVLTCRIAHLIDSGVPAWRILAITFTNKAAREMVERVDSLTGESGKDAWVSTFHSCCARILRRDIEKLGYKREFVIYDEDDRMTVIKGVAKQLGLSDKEYPPKAIKAAISDAKNRMLTPREWLKDAGDNFRNRKLCEAYEKYEAQLRSNNALDFDDLLIKTLELLSEHPPVLQYYQDKFDYVLVDEYQDTNIAQYQFVRLMAGSKRNLCVVGDDDQSIYGWRGADIRNILEFEKDFPDCKVIKLEQNYRSTANILDAANQVIAHNAGRKEKALWTQCDPGDKVGLYHAMDERDEAAFAALMSKKLINQGIRPGEIAVLYRTNAQSRVLEEAFVRAGVPNRIYGGQRFYDRKEVKDLIAYMRALVNPDDDVSVRRIINEPKRGIGDSTVEALSLYAEENELSLMAAALDSEGAGLSSRAQRLVGGFADLMVELTEAMYSMSITEFTSALIEKTGYIKALEESKTEENQTRIENIRELEGAVSEFAKLNPEGTLTDFLENVALITDVDNLNQTSGAVTLMTLHSAKGLEFDAVFLVGMEEGVFPLSRALFDETALEEERRLAYVGITRAKKKLYLSHAHTRMLYNARSANQLSRFVSEIPQRLIQEGAVKSQTRVPMPPRRSYEDAPRSGSYTSRPAPQTRGEKPSGKPALNIPGLQKGFGGGQSAPQRSLKLFREGDSVIHAVFGRGRVEAVEGEGGDQKVIVAFESGAKKRFSANIAPLRKLN